MLKEMVKSSTLEVKAKEREIARLKRAMEVH